MTTPIVHADRRTLRGALCSALPKIVKDIDMPQILPNTIGLSRRGESPLGCFQR